MKIAKIVSTKHSRSLSKLSIEFGNKSDSAWAISIVTKTSRHGAAFGLIEYRNVLFIYFHLPASSAASDT